jgi:hypothetical protein
VQKIAIHPKYGGFSLPADITSTMEAKGLDFDPWDYEIRNHPILIQAVEEGVKSGRIKWIKIIEIPDDVDWIINEYDGAEWVAERHRTWFFEEKKGE